MSGLFLIRHCSAEGQDADARLTAAGQAQAAALAARLAAQGFQRIVSSHFTRAIQSITPLALASGIEIEIDERLCERNLGQVPDGDWLSALARTFDEPDLVFPGGESSRQATQRGRAVVDACLASPVQPIALVTHGNLLSLIACSFDPTLGFDFWRGLTNPDVFTLMDMDDGRTLTRIP